MASCVLDDGFNEHLKILYEADLIIIGCPGSHSSVTGYMKTWLDRFCTSQLIFKVDENKNVSMISIVPEDMKAVIVVQGCTDDLDGVVKPIKTVLNALRISIMESVVIEKVGLTSNDNIAERNDILNKLYRLGKKISK